MPLQRFLWLPAFAGTMPGATKDADIEQRVRAMLSRMTLDEKISQMSQSTSLAS